MLSALAALRQFQLDFTGEQTSFRIRQVEDAIQRMGAEPPVPEIVRPEVSELDDLQGEFANLLSTIQPLTARSMSIEDAVQDVTLQQNISRIIQRLTKGYRAYDDITDTAVGFLTCLAIGLVLGKKEIEDNISSAVSESLAYISRETPFFGRSEAVTDSASLLQNIERGLSQGYSAIDIRWHALHMLSILRGTDSALMASPFARNMLHDLFSSLYSE